MVIGILSAVYLSFSVTVVHYIFFWMGALFVVCAINFKYLKHVCGGRKDDNEEWSYVVIPMQGASELKRARTQQRWRARARSPQFLQCVAGAHTDARASGRAGSPPRRAADDPPRRARRSTSASHHAAPHTLGKLYCFYKQSIFFQKEILIVLTQNKQYSLSCL